MNDLKNHFMKCQWGEWLIFGGGGREKDFGSKYIFFIYHKFNWFNAFKEVQVFKCSKPKNLLFPRNQTFADS
jgi:hypothetical protein